MNKEEKKVLPKEVPQKKVTTAKEKSTERKKKISNATVHETETHRDENQESQRNTEVARTLLTEVNYNISY